MLSRTADHLFWMARYMERAENTARMLDVNYQMSLLPQSADAAERGWRGLLSISELTGDFAKRYGEVTPKSVMDYMVQRRSTTRSSIRCCLMAARENARAVRGTLTTEVWETQNQTWLEFQRMLATRRLRARARASSSSGSSSARTCRAASPWARCCRTRRSTSCASAPSSSAPTTPRACST